MLAIAESSVHCIQCCGDHPERSRQWHRQRHRRQYHHHHAQSQFCRNRPVQLHHFGKWGCLGAGDSHDQRCRESCDQLGQCFKGQGQGQGESNRHGRSASCPQRVGASHCPIDDSGRRQCSRNGSDQSSRALEILRQRGPRSDEPGSHQRHQCRIPGAECSVGGLLTDWSNLCS